MMTRTMIFMYWMLNVFLCLNAACMVLCIKHDSGVFFTLNYAAVAYIWWNLDTAQQMRRIHLLHTWMNDPVKYFPDHTYQIKTKVNK